MKFLKKVNASVIGVSVLLALGCGKDDDSNLVLEKQVAKTCKLLEQVSHAYTTYYTNDAAGKVIRVYYKLPSTISVSGTDEELLYNAAGNISEIRTYNDNQVLLNFETYTYNAQQLPDTIKFYAISGSGPAIYYNYETFEYNPANLLIKKSLFDRQKNMVVKYSLFSYPAPGQSKEELYGLTNASPNKTTLVSTVVNQYDNKKSPLTLLNFYDLIVLVSKHNIIASNQTYHGTGSMESYTVSYLYNQEDFPVSESLVRQGSTAIYPTAWKYSCN